MRLPALVAALLILGAVAAVAVPWKLDRRRDGNRAAAIRALQAIRKAETVYRTAPGEGRRYAQDLAALGEALGRAGTAVPDLPSLGLKDGYRFGTLETDENGAPVDPGRRFAYYAVPETYGIAGVDTLLLDASGQVYALDRGTGVPPAAWPASDPAAAGWRILAP